MSLQADVAWLRAHTPLTREAAERLAGADWVAHTFCLAIHLDLKMIPVIEPRAPAADGGPRNPTRGQSSDDEG